MKQFKILPFVVVPLLLVSTFLISCLAILYEWSFEIITYAIFLYTTFYVLIFERIIPLKTNWRINKNHLWIDIKHFLFSAVAFDALGKAISLSLVLCLQEMMFISSEIWNKTPLIVAFLIANIIGEFFPYVYHRASHVGNKSSFMSSFLWKIHSIHHLPRSLNWLKTNWIHPANIFLNTLFKMTPLLFLGFGKEVIFLVGITHVVIAYLSHANIKTRTGILDYILVTPQVHHFHHSKLLNEAKNFGNIIPFWDLIFGTYYNRKGIVDEVGLVEEHFSYPKSERYIDHLKFPFKSLKEGCC